MPVDASMNEVLRAPGRLKEIMAQVPNPDDRSPGP
jgi:hypothetical protein